MHRIEWRLTRGGFSPDGTVTCDLGPDAPCHQDDGESGVEALYENGARVDECLAAVWINETGVSEMWFGARDAEVRSGEIDVRWDGADWVWTYVGEPWAEIDGQEEILLDRIETGTMDLDLKTEAVHVTLDDLEVQIVELQVGVGRLSDPGESV